MNELPTILIVPGMDGSGRLFEPLVERLQAEGWRVVMVDHCEEAPWLPPTAAVGQLVRQMTERLDAERAGRVVICGESFGSTAALAFAHRYPQRVSALVILSGFAWLPLSLRRRVLLTCYPLLQLLARFVPVGALRLARSVWNPLLGKAEREALKHAARAMHVPSARCLLAKTRIALRFDARPWLPDLSMPVLILAGERDRVVPPRCAREMARLIPRSRLLLIAEGGHLAHHARTELVLRSIQETVTQTH